MSYLLPDIQVALCLVFLHLFHHVDIREKKFAFKVGGDTLKTNYVPVN